MEATETTIVVDKGTCRSGHVAVQVYPAGMFHRRRSFSIHPDYSDPPEPVTPEVLDIVTEVWNQRRTF